MTERKCPKRAQYMERIALEAILRERAHTPVESARLEVLLRRESQMLRRAPERIAYLEAELAFLKDRLCEAQQSALSRQRTLPLVFVVQRKTA